jgi:tRNA1Val (adenine37-N6)-methyltransferase
MHEIKGERFCRSPFFVRYETMNAVELTSEETLDRLDGFDVQVVQHRDGYRFSTDPVLLSDFATIRRGDDVVDLGSGSAVIALIVARAHPTVSVLALELQAGQVARAQKSIFLNGLQDRIQMRQHDIRSVPSELHGRFDHVLCNPPFRPLGQGRCSQGDERARSRHEISGGLEAFVAASALLLRHGGVLSMIHLAERSAELMTAMNQYGLACKRLRYVHSRPGQSARLVLVEGRKGGGAGVAVEAPLYLYRDEVSQSPQSGQRDRYSDEVEAIYAGRCRCLDQEE